MNQRTHSASGLNGEAGTYAAILGVLCAIMLLLAACAPKTYPSARPKYGDSTTPIGPDKSLFKPPPKTQPKFQ